ncbi:hypothetical protein [Dyadobacter sp. MSC1_007]|uniref:hypothetical protein n=1 Tax=Dyadobacter sp. MSC1_007 TaxID=2909264 RepID=UPI00202EEDA6|nr:hypothetical protein [Dyadobacter sp. MSC1_007]
MTFLLFPSGFVSYFCSAKRSTGAGKADAGCIEKVNRKPEAKKQTADTISP